MAKKRLPKMRALTILPLTSEQRMLLNTLLKAAYVLNRAEQKQLKQLVSQSVEYKKAKQRGDI
jgi:hypothetical protein